MYRYNPKTKRAERAPTPATDAEAIGMLAGHPDSAAFVAEYERRRWEQGMEIEQALIFVGHHFRLERIAEAEDELLQILEDYRSERRTSKLGP